MFLHAPSHLFAQRLDIGRRCVADIDEEIAMQMRHLRAADDQATTARRVDELPGLVTIGVLEGRTASAAFLPAASSRAPA